MAAVRAWGSNGSPEAVGRPSKPGPYQDASQRDPLGHWYWLTGTVGAAGPVESVGGAVMLAVGRVLAAARWVVVVSGSLATPAAVVCDCAGGATGSGENAAKPATASPATINQVTNAPHLRTRIRLRR